MTKSLPVAVLVFALLAGLGTMCFQYTSDQNRIKCQQSALKQCLDSKCVELETCQKVAVSTCK